MPPKKTKTVKKDKGIQSSAANGGGAEKEPKHEQVDVTNPESKESEAAPTAEAEVASQAQSTGGGRKEHKRQVDLLEEQNEKSLKMAREQRYEKAAAKKRGFSPGAKSTKAKAAPKKRKQAPTSDDAAQSNKTARRGRSAPKSAPSPVEVLEYLLSPSCASFCRPKDEEELISSSSSKELRSYTSNIPLTPFEELLSALILSRPISHALGQRSIRTLLNAPHKFRTPKAITDAGVEKVLEVLFEARTQHKAKTAEQVYGFAGTCVEEGFAVHGADGELKGLRKVAEGEGGVEELRNILTANVKGMGKTGVDIFLRRVQGWWKDVYPFVDARTSKSVDLLSLPAEAEALHKLVADSWHELNVKDVGGKDEEEKKRIAFVLILERAVGADLEGKVDQVLEASAKA